MTEVKLEERLTARQTNRQTDRQKYRLRQKDRQRQRQTVPHHAASIHTRPLTQQHLLNEKSTPDQDEKEAGKGRGVAEGAGGGGGGGTLLSPTLPSLPSPPPPSPTLPIHPPTSASLTHAGRKGRQHARLWSQQHASVSQGRICSDNFTCCHTEIQVADQTFLLTQSQYTDTGPTSPTDPITPGAWHGSHWSASV